MNAVPKDQLFLNEEDHTYWLMGQRFPSVSEIISPVCSYDGVPVEVLERKSAIGKALHTLSEWHDRDGLKSIDRKSIDPAVAPYFEGWRKFMREMKPKWELIEHRKASTGLGFAGTLDRYGCFLGERWMIDIKTVASVRNATGLQLAGYCVLQGVNNSVKRGAVQLTPDGKYKLHEFKDPLDYTVFLGLLSVTKWRIRNGE